MVWLRQQAQETCENDLFGPLLGLSKDQATGVMHRRKSAAFSLAIEVRAKGCYVVHPDVNAAVAALTRGEGADGIRVGNWPELQVAALAS